MATLITHFILIGLQFRICHLHQIGRNLLFEGRLCLMQLKLHYLEIFHRIRFTYFFRLAPSQFSFRKFLQMLIIQSQLTFFFSILLLNLFENRSSSTLVFSELQRASRMKLSFFYFLEIFFHSLCFLLSYIYIFLKVSHT